MSILGGEGMKQGSLGPNVATISYCGNWSMLKLRNEIEVYQRRQECRTQCLVFLSLNLGHIIRSNL